MPGRSASGKGEREEAAEAMRCQRRQGGREQGEPGRTVAARCWRSRKRPGIAKETDKGEIAATQAERGISLSCVDLNTKRRLRL